MKRFMGYSNIGFATGLFNFWFCFFLLPFPSITFLIVYFGLLLPICMLYLFNRRTQTSSGFTEYIKKNLEKNYVIEKQIIAKCLNAKDDQLEFCLAEDFDIQTFYRKRVLPVYVTYAEKIYYVRIPLFAKPLFSEFSVSILDSLIEKQFLSKD